MKELCLMFSLFALLGTTACNKEPLSTPDETDVTSPDENAPDHSSTFQYNTVEIWCQRGDNRIYGELYVPQGIDGQMPLVVLSHSFGGNASSLAPYARALAERGYMAYCFDFCGSTSGSRSDGATTEMSIRTEEADVKAIIDRLGADGRVDATRIYLIGSSQGGMVTAMTAADYPEQVRAAVLIYPALVIPDMVRSWFPRREDITSRNLWGVQLGSIYSLDAYDYDVYTEIVKFQKDVLIIHGTSDSTVPISYSERAVEAYHSAEQKTIEGAGHDFYGSQQTQAIGWILDFLNKQEKAASE